MCGKSTGELWFSVFVVCMFLALSASELKWAGFAGTLFYMCERRAQCFEASKRNEHRAHNNKSWIWVVAAMFSGLELWGVLRLIMRTSFLKSKWKLNYFQEQEKSKTVFGVDLNLRIIEVYKVYITLLLIPGKWIVKLPCWNNW